MCTQTQQGCECLENAIECIHALSLEGSVDVEEIRQKLTERQYILPDILANTGFAYWMQLHCIQNR